MHNGWPSPLGVNLEAPIAADLDGDGKLEILWGQRNGLTVRREDGTVFPGWPRPYLENPGGPPSVANLNGEPIVGMWSIDNTGLGQVSLWHGDGTALPGWPKSIITGNIWAPHEMPLVFADMDGDGRPEVIYISSTAQDGNGRAVINVDRVDGTALPGWPVTLPPGNADIYDGSPAVADIDGDGFLDLAVVTFDGKIFVYRNTGALFPGWPVTQGSGDFSLANSVSFADVNSDSQLELVVTTYDGGVGVYGPTGLALPGWPKFVGGKPQPPAFADLDGDGKPEIAFGTLSSALYVLHADASNLAGWPKAFSNRVHSVALADLDSDGHVDLLATDGDRNVHAWSSAGNALTALGFPFQIAGQFGFYSAPMVADVDGDGLIEFFAQGGSFIAVWDLPTSFNPFLAPHATYMGDNQHTSRHAPEPTLNRPINTVYASPDYVTQFSVSGTGFLKGMRAFIGDREQVVSDVTATTLTVTANNAPSPQGPFAHYPLTVANVNSGPSEPLIDAVWVWASTSPTPTPTPTATPLPTPTPRPILVAYRQSPHHSGGSSSDGGQVTVADDFQLTGDAVITRIRWWGAYFNPPPVPDTFTLRIFADGAGRPGELIRTLDLAQIARLRTWSSSGNLAEFEYSADLRTPFLSRGGVKYWISIVNPPAQVWTWEASSDHNVSGSQRSFANPISGPWEPYDVDLAFQLESTGGGLANISTRGSVGTADNLLIAGFIVTGAEPRRVLLRAIGPSLNINGNPMPGRLDDPTLELHDGSGAMIASNNDWRVTQIGGIISEDQSAEIQATGAAPTEDRESAIIATLSANSAFTAIIRGVGGTSGKAVAEVYDLDNGAAAKLANISTRSFVQSGDNVMIGGFIIRNPSGRVIIRALGPSLQPLGVPNALPDPLLELRDASGALLASNDSWRSDQEAEIIATTVPPSQDLESAIVTTLPAGAYTAIIQDANSETGVGLVEVYDLDP